MPRAFGTFNQNLTLTREVCGSCNQYFGDNLELPLARDSIEAHERVRHGLRSAGSLQIRGERLVISVASAGPWTGALVSLGVGSQGQPVVYPLPQAGFPRVGGGGRIYQSEHELSVEDWSPPPEADLTGQILVLSSNEADEVRIKALLVPRGYSFEEAPNDFDGDEIRSTGEGGIEVEIVGTLDAIVQRAVSKIVFNYLCHSQGAAFVLSVRPGTL